MADRRIVYMDNNATTRVAPEVREAMMPFLDGRYGNPSSMHRFGGSVRKHVDTAREQVADLLNADPREIVFTSCGTESDNAAIQGFCETHGNASRLITSVVEHPAVLNTCRHRQKRGTPLAEIGVDEDGMLAIHDLTQAPIDPHTLATFMWANNETGVIFPIDKIAEHVKSKGGLMHTDAVQAVGKVPVDVTKVPVDLLALSGHKLHAPKGVGALYIRKGTALAPLIHGGHQEDGRRGGTENVPYIVGLGKACELAASRMREEQSRVKALRDRLETELLATCTGAKLNGHHEHRLPNTANISFEFIEGESILLLLDEKGIAASSGSACTSGSLEPSHVMRAMGIPYTMAHGSTRFSLSIYNTDADVDAVIEAMPGIVERLRGLSPYVK
ncbi:MAG: cysteine desulfurase NifS [Chitinivibrionales bacterium]|nr:cysteine desulfurase NifS [Chitinivibrionales bacterium]MBD3396251.1 cysteine desulfurase NifS [Chitinivibrionales bacterium]